jgi:hypothetical protein
MVTETSARRKETKMSNSRIAPSWMNIERWNLAVIIEPSLRKKRTQCSADKIPVLQVKVNESRNKRNERRE